MLIITINHDQHFNIFGQRLKEHMHETTVSQFNIAENVADLYKEKQAFLMIFFNDDTIKIMSVS